jgi:hypothetical protein
MKGVERPKRQTIRREGSYALDEFLAFGFLQSIVGVLGYTALELEVYEMTPDLAGDQHHFQARDKALPARHRGFVKVHFGTVIQELPDVGLYLRYLF